MIRFSPGRLPPRKYLLLAGCLLAVALWALAHGRQVPPTAALRAPALRTHYLIDYEYQVDAANGFATMGHLLVYNPGPRPVPLTVTVYYEDREPQPLHLLAPAQASTETNYSQWPLTPNRRCALRVTSPEPVVCQATVGWTNTGNDYSPRAATKSRRGVRETAKSYQAIPELARTWYLADGLVLNTPATLWIRESESAVVLNPGEQPAEVVLTLHTGGEPQRHPLAIPPRRLRALALDPLVPPNRHYGATFTSSQPVAVQWLRTVHWYDSEELMAWWSVPGVPLRAAAELPP